MKTATYGLMHLTVAVTVAYALTRDLKAALAIGMIEPCIQTIAYAFHERLWQKFRARRAQSSAPDGMIAIQ